MQGPVHNFIANGIVSHNSHAVTYAVVGYWMLWLKTYYPAQFYEACLRYEGDDMKAKRLIHEFTAIGGQVHLLDPAHSRATFRAVGPYHIYGGYGNLRGLGPKTAEKLLGLAPFDSWDAMLAALPKAVRRALEGEPGARVLLAPWFPAPPPGDEDRAVRERYGYLPPGALPPSEVSEVGVAGFVTMTLVKRDRLEAILEDNTGAAVVKSARRSVGALTEKFRALRVGDFVGARGWWNGEAMYVNDIGKLTGRTDEKS